MPSAALRAAEVPAIDFSLEEANPESVARANARVPKPPATSALEAPPGPQQTKVDATLELAEIMLSMGLGQGAAQALAE